MSKEVKNGSPSPEEQLPNIHLDSLTLSKARSGEPNENFGPDERQAIVLLKKLEGIPEAADITFEDAFHYVLDGVEGVDPTKSSLLTRAEKLLKKEVADREKPPRIMSYLEIPGNGMYNKLCFVLGIDSDPDSMDGTMLGSEKFRKKHENILFLREIAAANNTNIVEIFRKRLEAFGFRTRDLTILASIKEGYPRTINLKIYHNDGQGYAMINRSFFLHIPTSSR